MSIESKIVFSLFFIAIANSSQAQEIDKTQAASNYLACAAKTAMVNIIANIAGIPTSEEKSRKLKMLIGMYMIAGKNLTDEESMKKIYLEKTQDIASSLKSAKSKEELESQVLTIAAEMEKCAKGIESDDLFKRIMLEEAEKKSKENG